MVFDIFKGIITLFQKHQKEKISHESDMIYIRKRQLFHKDIPDLNTIKSLTGNHFYMLQNIFNDFDPIQSEKLSQNPKKYELLTKTVIYKIYSQKSKKAIADMVYLEFSLWFKHEYNSFKRKEELINEIYNFKKSHLSTNPFEKISSNSQKL